MRKAEADAFHRERIEHLRAIPLKRRVAFFAVRVDQHGVGVVQGGIVVDTRAIHLLCGPAAVIHLHGDAWDRRESFLHQQAAGPEFVHAWGMARLAGDEDDPLVGAPELKVRDG